jgi:hypothetical protein
VEQRLAGTGVNVRELRRTALPRPASSLFAQVRALAGPDWQSRSRAIMHDRRSAL